MRSGVGILACVLGLGLPPAAAAQSACDGAAYHRLDFWVGEWTVFVGERQVGSNRIVPILGGCAIEEHWVAGTGAPGRSLFYYVPAADQWRQVWVTTNPGQPGGVKEKREVPAMPEGIVRFQGEIALADGRTWLDRTTLTRHADGSVRQLIEYSTDGGTSWRTSFDAVYRRAAAR